MLKSKRTLLLIAAGLALSFLVERSGLVSSYVLQILMYVGINIILTLSLNLVNGYMGEFSVGHAGFMAVGAYMASIVTVWVFRNSLGWLAFPVAILAGGAAAAGTSLIVAIPSFRTRGDYLAIVTLAFNMIVKSLLENIEALGGPRGFLGMNRLTNLVWVYVWCAITIYIIRNFVYSNYGRAMLSIREDEVASNLVSVNTRQTKVLVFVISAFFAGVAGALFAHLVQFINPRTFSIQKSTDILVMVYLGGIGSIFGSILGATVYTVLLELLRPLGVWRWVVGPLMLVVLMITRPTGIMGLREFLGFVPREERAERRKEGTAIAAASR
ncbi:MAG: branched-chain amino acid ABC transporter permease [Bacillota bacterium]|nr:branched-chain amino acid ABC transporter permease [Bacillota bacterium]